MIEANLVGEVPCIEECYQCYGFFRCNKRWNSSADEKSWEINRILGKVDNLNLSEEQVNIPFVIGETVKVIDGPFNSFHAGEAIDEQKEVTING